MCKTLKRITTHAHYEFCRKMSDPKEDAGGTRLLLLLAVLADTIDIERVIGHLIALFSGYFLLTVFDHLVDEFVHLTALDTQDMVMVFALIQFKNGLTALEMVPGHQAGLLKLGQYAVDGRQTDFLAALQQCLVDIFGAHVPDLALFQKMQDLDTRQRRLEAGIF